MRASEETKIFARRSTVSVVTFHIDDTLRSAASTGPTGRVESTPNAKPRRIRLSFESKKPRTGIGTRSPSRRTTTFVGSSARQPSVVAPPAHFCLATASVSAFSRSEMTSFVWFGA